MISRTRLAAWLNRMNGCTVFTAWNVGEIPDVDLEVLQAWAHYAAQYEGQ